jgi:hypothetical protein
MKKLSRVLSIGLMALAIAGLQLNLQAQQSEGSAAKETAAKADRAIPFHGTLKAVDKGAGTVTVGGRTFQLTTDTKYLQGSLEEAKVGEKVGGSYRKSEDGTLRVNSIRFGEKPEKSTRSESNQE